MANTTKSSLVELIKVNSGCVRNTGGRNSRSVIGQGRLRSYFEPMGSQYHHVCGADTQKVFRLVGRNKPPGAVGGR